jgi:hypothetical protein
MQRWALSGVKRRKSAQSGGKRVGFGMSEPGDIPSATGVCPADDPFPPLLDDFDACFTGVAAFLGRPRGGAFGGLGPSLAPWGRPRLRGARVPSS